MRGTVREVLLGIRTVAEMVEAFRDEEKCRPSIAHQVSRGVDLFLEHPFDFIAWAPRICARPSSRQLGRGL